MSFQSQHNISTKTDVDLHMTVALVLQNVGRIWAESHCSYRFTAKGLWQINELAPSTCCYMFGNFVEMRAKTTTTH